MKGGAALYPIRGVHSSPEALNGVIRYGKYPNESLMSRLLIAN